MSHSESVNLRQIAYHQCQGIVDDFVDSENDLYIGIENVFQDDKNCTRCFMKIIDKYISSIPSSRPLSNDAQQLILETDIIHPKNKEISYLVCNGEGIPEMMIDADRNYQAKNNKIWKEPFDEQDYQYIKSFLDEFKEDYDGKRFMKQKRIKFNNIKNIQDEREFPEYTVKCLKNRGISPDSNGIYTMGIRSNTDNDDAAHIENAFIFEAASTAFCITYNLQCDNIDIKQKVVNKYPLLVGGIQFSDNDESNTTSTCTIVCNKSYILYFNSLSLYS